MGDALMRAAVRERYGRPRDVVHIREVRKPAPEADQVLVRVRATSVNRADYYTVAPFLLFRKQAGGGFRAPRTHELGGDFSGVVEEVGGEVAGLAPGDEVFGSRSGAFGEYVAARMLVPKPANVSFEGAACLPVAGVTALQALRDRGRLQPGQSVLVNGASGAVGPFAVQIAKALGAAFVTAVCSARNVAQTRGLGADRVLDYAHEDFTATGERYDLIVDTAATKPWRDVRRALTPGGTYVLVGSPIVSALCGPLPKIGWMFLASRFGGGRFAFFVASFAKRDLETLRELVATGKVRPVIERAYRFAEIAAALEHVGAGHARAKVVVTL